MKAKNSKAGQPHFPAVPLTEANQRAGKHHKIVSDILSDLARLDQYSAIKIDLVEVGTRKAHLRAALHRAAKKKNVDLVTTSDERYLYVFRFSSKNPT